MTQMTDFERSIGAWLDATGPVGVPDRMVDAALEEASRRRQVRVWLPVLETDFPMQTTLRFGRVPSLAWLLAVLLALVLAVAAVLAIGALYHPLPPPFGLAGNGVIAFDTGGQIVTERSDGSSRSILATGAGTRTWPVFSPDGSQVGYWVQPTPTTFSIVLAKADGSELQTISVPDGWVDEPGSLSWAPDARHVGIATSVGIVVFDATTGAPTKLGVGGATSVPMWSADGTRIAYAIDLPAHIQDVHVMDADGGHDRIVATTPKDTGGLSWQPGGDRIAYYSGPDIHDIYVLDPNNGAVEDVSKDQRDEFTAVWSPDGRRLAFLRNIREGNLQSYKVVVIVQMDAPDRTQAVIDPIASAQLPANAVLDGAQVAWSPDGTEMAAFVFDNVANGTGDSRVLVFETATGTPIATLASTGNVGALSWQRVAR